MSDSGQEETKSRRRHKDDHDSPAKEVRSRRKSYSDDSEDPQTRRRDRSPVRTSNRYQDEDDDFDKDHTRRDRRDQRDGYQKRRYAADDSKRERNYRPRSGSQDRSRHHPRSRSPPTKRRRHSNNTSRSPPPPKAIEPRSRAPLPSQAASFRGGDNIIPTTDSAPAEKQKPNYAPTGLLAKEANTISGTTTVLKYHEPPEARKPPPSQSWRLYVFSGKELLDTIHLHTRSAWLLGRDESVVDYLLEDGRGVSKQHAVVQFRYISTMDEFGVKSGRVRPYLIDLESQGGTRLNGEKVRESRYVELVDGDVVAFGEGGREFVVMLPEAEKSEKVEKA